MQDDPIKGTSTQCEGRDQHALCLLLHGSSPSHSLVPHSWSWSWDCGPLVWRTCRCGKWVVPVAERQGKRVVTARCCPAHTAGRAAGQDN
jgi:hypothetical protein